MELPPIIIIIIIIIIYTLRILKLSTKNMASAYHSS